MSVGASREHHAARLGALGAVLTIAGMIASGPPVFWLMSVLHPTPSWSGPDAFAESAHWTQTIPFFGGFVLLFGYLCVMAALYHLADDASKPRLTLSLIVTAMFATLILFNYVCQTTFVPALARAYDRALGPTVSALSLQNPRSLSWAIEMWGYALLGVATWLAAPALGSAPLERVAAGLMVANGVMSLTGAAITAIRLDWVMTNAGIASYLAWNVLMFALSVVLLMAFHRREASATLCPNRRNVMCGERRVSGS
jgi:hypothetical protein